VKPERQDRIGRTSSSCVFILSFSICFFYSFSAKKLDELDRYLNFELDKSKLLSSAVNLWRDQKEKFARLSCLARSIFLILAASAEVERQFSGAELVMQEKQTNLNSKQLDNILLVRSMQKD
jgi:hypothetical protein